MAHPPDTPPELVRLLPAERLHWRDATNEQLAFMRGVYDTQLERCLRAGRFTPDVPATERRPVEGRFTLRATAAEGCRALLAEARAAIATEGVRVRIGVDSAYRSATRQFAIWQRTFADGYQRTVAIRAALDGGPHGPAAAAHLDAFLRARVSVPGFSDHNAALAVDFQNTEGRLRIPNRTTTEATCCWRSTWFYGWLMRNAERFGFRENPRIDEPWHWEYRARRQPATAERSR